MYHTPMTKFTYKFVRRHSVKTVALRTVAWGEQIFTCIEALNAFTCSVCEKKYLPPAKVYLPVNTLATNRATRICDACVQTLERKW